MRRSVLLTLAALGATVSLVGGAGVFSALTDTARTGTNSVESAALAGSADIRLASATINGSTGQVECGTFSEDLASGFFDVTDASPGFNTRAAFFCVKNVGSQPVTLSAMADELTDVDVACTGDEELHGDTTCGQDAAGELADVLIVSYTTHPSCDGSGSGRGYVLRTNATTSPHAFGSLAVGATGCFSALVNYRSDTAAQLVQKAQSDRVTWRYRFSAQS